MRNIRIWIIYQLISYFYVNLKKCVIKPSFIILLLPVPSNPRYMMESEENRTILKWNAPEKPAGPNDYYEVAVTIWYKDKQQRRHISAVWSMACAVKIPACLDSHYKNTLEVRAVNLAHKSKLDEKLYAKYQQKINKDDENYYTGNEDLACVGVHVTKEKLKEQEDYLRTKSEYVEYKSGWEKGTEYGCADNTKLSRITTIAFVVVITSLTAMSAFYFTRLKILEMAGINVKLPGDLDASHYNIKPHMNLTVVNNSHNIKMSNTELEYHGHSKESIFQPESHHLLSPACNEPNFMVTGAVNHCTPCSLGNRDYEGSAKSSALSALNSEVGGSSETLTTPLEDPGYQFMVSARNKSVQDGYVQPQNLAKNQKALLSMLPMESAYVKPGNIFPWAANSSANSDYVQTHMLTKPMNNVQLSNKADNYTTLETLIKKSAPSTKTESGTIEDLSEIESEEINNLQPISGYVTHKQLTDFGKQQKQQQEQLRRSSQTQEEHLS